MIITQTQKLENTKNSFFFRVFVIDVYFLPRKTNPRLQDEGFPPSPNGTRIEPIKPTQQTKQELTIEWPYNVLSRPT
jgi:hypothetical protein